jgi:Cof subfamily protein (haloacid dehalogenase superfamily)
VLLAFDLDRTVLTEEYELPSQISEAIFEARARGHLVTVLTGRQYGSAKPYLEQLQIDLPHSTNHGARVRDRAGTELRRVLMEGGFADKLLAGYVEDQAVDFSAVMDDTLYVRDPEHERWNWVHASSRAVVSYRAGVGLDYDKVVFQTGDYNHSQKLNRLIGLDHPDVLRYLWGDGFLEVVPTGADKGSALEWIADSLGVARSDVVAFGDGANDVSMIGWAGTGVAVGPHAHPDVLAGAKEHIAAPEEGGVADWIRRNLL